MSDRKRKKLHPEYFRIRGMQIVANLSDFEVASALGCTTRTYRDKIYGWSDFRPLEAEKLAEIFNSTQDFLFFTGDVSRTEQKVS